SRSSLREARGRTAAAKPPPVSIPIQRHPGSRPSGMDVSPTPPPPPPTTPPLPGRVPAASTDDGKSGRTAKDDTNPITALSIRLLRRRTPSRQGDPGVVWHSTAAGAAASVVGSA
ncbi:unnamed protein product, partial [Ectocarpus sp. 12 AP-2014]